MASAASNQSSTTTFGKRYKPHKRRPPSDESIARRAALRTASMIARTATFYGDIRPRMIEQRRAGMTYQKIADLLNEEGRRTMFGSAFNPQIVQRLIAYPVPQESTP